MKTFEMPKMNVAIFSLEDVITTSTGTEPAVNNLNVAKQALADAGVTEANITATSASDWVAAN